MPASTILTGEVRLFFVDANGEEHELGPASIEAGPPPGLGLAPLANHTFGSNDFFMPAPDRYARVSGAVQLSLDGMAEEGPLRRRMRAWEKQFLLEEPWTDFPKTELAAKMYDGIKVAEDRRKTVGYSLKEIAQAITPGTLGVHMVGGEVYNLVYRSERIDDPRKKILKGSEWREVKDVEEVLWAAATLEAYNILDETGLEFVCSQRVEKWLTSLTSVRTAPLTRLNSPLFDYQQEAVNFLWDRKRAMLSLSPGLGKSLTASFAAAIRHSQLGDVGNVLLVCPASLLYYWRSELEKWHYDLPFPVESEVWHKRVGTVPSLHESYQFWAITNPETLVRFSDEFKKKFHLMIVDESIMFKHRESIRSQKLNSVARTIEKVWLLTGAPATRYLDDFWHQFHILNNRGYSSYWRWADRYCWVEKEIWGDAVVANRKGAEERVKENFADIYFARSQDQVADIPDWLFEDIDIPMKPKQDAIYQKLRKELKIVIEGYPKDKVLKINDRMALSLRSLQVASNPLLLGSDNSSGKWSALVDIMEIYPGPYLVWVNFTRTGEVIRDLLAEKYGDDKVAFGNGDTEMEERNSITDKFQKGEYQVLVLNSAAFKFGFTLTKARTAIFLERNFDDSYFQCLHRNRRIGTEFSPVIVNMRSVTLEGKRTIDHVVHDSLDYRNGMIKNVTAGDILEVLDE